MDEIRVVRGDDHVLDVAIVDPTQTPTGYNPDGTPIYPPAVLTGCTLEFTVKVNVTDTEPLIYKQSAPNGGIIITNAALGRAQIQIAAADTAGVVPPTGVDNSDLLSWGAEYFYDLQLTDTGGAIYTVQRGRFIVQLDLTRPNP